MLRLPVAPGRKEHSPCPADQSQVSSAEQSGEDRILVERLQDVRRRNDFPAFQHAALSGSVDLQLVLVDAKRQHGQRGLLCTARFEIRWIGRASLRIEAADGYGLRRELVACRGPKLQQGKRRALGPPDARSLVKILPMKSEVHTCRNLDLDGEKSLGGLLPIADGQLDPARRRSALQRALRSKGHHGSRTAEVGSQAAITAGDVAATLRELDALEVCISRLDLQFRAAPGATGAARQVGDYAG